MYSSEFCELINHPAWENEFVGYGNPDADILIIGQEAACPEGTDDWRKYYQHNCEQWKETVEKMLFAKEFNGIGEYRFPEFFNPSFPFKWQKSSPKKGVGLSGSTWYWYQRLINELYPEQCIASVGRINFFEKAFITELNGQTRVNQQVKLDDLEGNIRHRFDIMRLTSPFWSHFKVVLFLCGPYAKAINIKQFPSDKSKELYSSIFGEAVPFYYSQFSGRTNPMKFIREEAHNIKNEL